MEQKHDPVASQSSASGNSDEIFSTQLTQSSPQSTGTPQTKPLSNVLGKVILGVTGALAVGLVALTTPFVTPALRKVCLPYVPATERQVANVLEMCKIGRGKTLVDLGSGDGRVANLHHYDKIVIFGVSEMMPKLQDKVYKEMKEDGHIVACRFPFASSWQSAYEIQDGIDSVWLYTKKCLASHFELALPNSET